MVQISAEEFERAVELDPAWAAKLTEPVEIVDTCNLQGSPITHLSPLLHFTTTGLCASFADCPNLRSAQGTFHGIVDFSRSAIEKVEEFELKPLGSLHIKECQNLKQLTGTFAGHVNAKDSALESINGLVVTHCNRIGEAASFQGCKNLKIAEGTFHGSVAFSDSGVEKIRDLIIHRPNHPVEENKILEQGKSKTTQFIRCMNLHTAEGYYPDGVRFSHSGIRHIGKLELGSGPNDLPIDKPKAVFTNCRQLQSAHEPMKWVKSTDIEIDPETEAQLIRFGKAREKIQKTPTLDL